MTELAVSNIISLMKLSSPTWFFGITLVNTELHYFHLIIPQNYNWPKHWSISSEKLFVLKRYNKKKKGNELEVKLLDQKLKFWNITNLGHRKTVSGRLFVLVEFDADSITLGIDYTYKHDFLIYVCRWYFVTPDKSR